jgi:hypothetical protein
LLVSIHQIASVSLRAIVTAAILGEVVPFAVDFRVALR